VCPPTAVKPALVAQLADILDLDRETLVILGERDAR